MKKEFRYSDRVVLKNGDKIRISGGPYYIANSGRKYHVGVAGIHTFSHVDDDGNMFVRNKRGILVMVYMGEEKIAPLTGTHLCPHKIAKIRKKIK